jgi:hypothetical protein
MRSILYISQVFCLGWLMSVQAAGEPLEEMPEFQQEALSEGTFQVRSWTSVNVQLLTESEGIEFRAKGLPKGLTCDAETGIISGYPMKAGEAKVTLTAKAGILSASRQVTVTVAPFPEQAVGEFQGLLDVGEEAWSRWGGMVSLKVTGGGLLTGKVRVGKRAYLIKGTLLGDGSGDYSTTAEVTPGVQVTLTSFNNHSELHGEFIGDGTEGDLGFTTVRHLPKRGTEIAGVKGTYNVSLSVPTWTGANRPRGYGFLVAKVGADGGVKLAGKLPDGTAVTASSLLVAGNEEQHQILVHVPLYERRLGGSPKKISTGVVYGALDVHPAKGEWHPESRIDDGQSHSLVWLKAAQEEAETDGLYTSGFDLRLDANGSVYRKPAVGELLLGAERGDSNSELLFYETFPGTATWRHEVTLNARHQAYLAKGQADNLSKFKLKLNASTGVFSGSFRLELPSPQTVPFSGIIIPSAEGNQAFGHFLLRDFPDGLTEGTGEVKSYLTVLEAKAPVLDVEPEETPNGNDNGLGLGLGGTGFGEGPLAGGTQYLGPRPVGSGWNYGPSTPGGSTTTTGGSTTTTSGSTTTTGGSLIISGSNVNYWLFNSGGVLIYYP